MMRLFTIAIIGMLGVFLVGCNSSLINDNTAETGLPFTFQQKASIPGEGRAAAVSFAINGKGYVALGRNKTGNSLNDCWEYDPDQNIWTQKSSFPGIERVKAIAAVVNNNAYVGLGYSPETGGCSDRAAYLTDFWKYDPANDVWNKKAQFPTKYTDACFCFVSNNEIYVGAGFNGVSFTGEFWKYNPLQDNWTQLKNLPGINRTLAVACADDQHIFFGTGFMTSSANDWWEYSPATDNWSSRKQMPDHGRQNSVALCINNRYFVATGRYWKGSVIANEYVKADIEEYDPINNKWISHGEIPNGKRENAIAFTINGKGYIGFGENDVGMVNSFWSFEP